MKNMLVLEYISLDGSEQHVCQIWAIFHHFTKFGFIISEVRVEGKIVTTEPKTELHILPSPILTIQPTQRPLKNQWKTSCVSDRKIQ